MKDKLTLLGELLDPTIPKSDREHVAVEEIHSLESLLHRQGWDIERLKIEIGILNGTHKFMQDSLKELQNEINRLNQMLRETGYGQGQIDAYAAQCEEIDRLHEKIKLQNKDWCDDDEAIKQQALRVLSKEIVEGDSVHVPRMGELAEMMANEIMRLRKVLETIVDPIKFLRIEAEEEGLKINGMMASMLSDDANYLKELAKEGLEGLKHES